MDSESIVSSIPRPAKDPTMSEVSPIVRRKGEKEAILRVFRASRDMRQYHQRLFTVTKPSSTLATPASRLSPDLLRREGLPTQHVRQGSDACTETDFDQHLRFGIQIEKKSRFGSVLHPELITTENCAQTSTVPRRLLATAGNARPSVLPLSSKAPKRHNRKECFSETVEWSEPVTRTIPLIDFNSTVRTTVVHVEEAFSPSHSPRSSLGFYSSFPLKTSPRTKRLPLSLFAHRASKPPVSPTPFLPEDKGVEGLLHKAQFERTMWQYRGPSLKTAGVFDPRPIAALQRRFPPQLPQP